MSDNTPSIGDIKRAESTSVVGEKGGKKRRKKTSKTPSNNHKRAKKKRTSSNLQGDKESNNNRISELTNEMKQGIDRFDILYEELGKEIGTHNYKVVALLGVGSQGRVYLVRLENTGKLYAMKVFLKEEIIDNPKVLVDNF